MWNLLDGNHLIIVLQLYLDARRMMIEKQDQIRRVYVGMR